MNSSAPAAMASWRISIALIITMRVDCLVSLKISNMIQPIPIRQIVIQQNNIWLKGSSYGIPIIEVVRTLDFLEVLKQRPT